MNENVCFVDVETTGLDPSRHEVWEIALIEGDGTEHVWAIEPRDLRAADENALRITRFYQRIAAAGWREETIEEGYPKRQTKVRRANFWSPESRRSIARQIAHLTAGKHLVGACPWFDLRFLADFCGREEFVLAAHYHLIDVEALAVGYLAGIDSEPRNGWAPPWNSHDVSALLGIPETPPEDRHTALGDARWAKAVYEKVMG